MFQQNLLVPQCGVRTIFPEKKCAPVRVRVWFRVRIRIRVELEPLNVTITTACIIYSSVIKHIQVFQGVI